MKTFVLASFAQSLSVFRGPLLAAMKHSGQEVHVAAPDLVDDARTVAAMHSLGGTCHHVPMERTGLNPFKDAFTLVAAFVVLRRLRPAHFLGYTVKPVVYGTLAAWLARVPHRTALITGLGYVFGEHAAGSRRLLQHLVRLLYRLALSASTRVIFQNPDDRALFIELGIVSAHKTAVVNGSGVQLDRFACKPLPASPCSFLLIARLLKDKGIHEYIEAARKVKAEHPDAVFHLAGWIDSNPLAIDRRELDGWIDEGLVRFHGRLEDVREVLSQCHVYVLPSYREGTPRTVLEAMATGRAVVTTDAPGCRETVVDGDNGFLVPVADAEALARAMMRLAADPALAARMGARSRQIAEDKYDVHAVNAHMLQLMGVTADEASSGYNRLADPAASAGAADAGARMAGSPQAWHSGAVQADAPGTERRAVHAAEIPQHAGRIRQ
jgi:glycosyltransferase involved in cell wall biosynthesis